MELLRRWLAWAQRCRLTPCVRLAKTISAHLMDIEAALLHRLARGDRVHLFTDAGRQESQHKLALGPLDL